MIEWNKVTWYSKLGAIIFFLVILPVLSFYIGIQYKEVKELNPPDQFDVDKPLENMDVVLKSYTSEKYGFSFKYSTDYRIDEIEMSSANENHIIIGSERGLALSRNGANGNLEPASTLTISIRPNPEKLSLQQIVQKMGNFPEYLVHSFGKFAGEDAFIFEGDGLHASNNILFNKDSYTFLIRNELQGIQTADDILRSFTFEK